MMDTSTVGLLGPPQYASVHVYVQPGQFDAFVTSWVATFGGTTTDKIEVDVTPTPSLTYSQVILSPVGTLSVFEFIGPTPYPFGSERIGWLTADIDASVQAARDSGAAIVVAPFPDPVGRHTIIQFPGGVTVQLYWVSAPLSFPALRALPDSRIYLSPDTVDAFLRAYLPFTSGTVTADRAEADGAIVGKPGSTVRRIRIASPSGNTVVWVTDGHLPHPYGRELAGYAVADLTTTVTKAQASGATVLAPPMHADDTDSAMLQFPGGYIAEVHTGAPSGSRKADSCA